MWKKRKELKAEGIATGLISFGDDIELKRAEILRSYRSDLVQSLGISGPGIGRTAFPFTKEERERITRNIKEIDGELMRILLTREIVSSSVSGGVTTDPSFAMI